MAERRVANIVRQTAGLNNIADVRWFQPGGQIAGGLQRITHTHSQGTPYAGDFQAVSEAVVHMIVGGQRVNLCLASQATKRARENDFVVIRIKRRSDRKSTRLNSSHVAISYAVFCLKKKNTQI